MLRVVSGGQTGADRAALDFAVRHGLPHGGWCPRGGWAEDRATPPGIRAEFPALRETATADPAERTLRNVRDANALLVLAGPRDLAASPGTAAALREARRLGRPACVIDPGDPGAAPRLRGFLSSLAPGASLNVAGPRESESPGIAARAGALLEACGDAFAPAAQAGRRATTSIRADSPECAGPSSTDAS